MASLEQVKQYLAYWFQLGKPLIVNGKTSDGRSKVLPQAVIQGDRYSPEFEACWQHITSGAWKSSYLEGTIQTIEELLSSQWDISSCARCAMPVPMLGLGVQTSGECPCSDLPDWPNTELPQPRDPINSRRQLTNIRDRLSQI
ncbi:hypothetical protein NDI45_22065 [Leptolyngbya sp. GB1-A1]|uniref:hypothetical protein n=1 Tax=Leptolyngbya sp. GB1-A1 TaxID=2933908 RepID=UPI00329A53AA